MSEGAFSRRGARALAALAAASLVAAGFLGVFGDELSVPPSFGADTFSRSAIGHAAFAKLLRDLGFPVIVSRHRTAEKAAGDAVLLLLEPVLESDGDGPRSGLLDDMVGESGRMLLVLPKRRGTPDPLRPRWLGASFPVPVEDARRVLAAAGVDGEVVRPAGPVGAWRGPLPAPTLDGPQLVRSDALTPLVETDEGILAGEIDRDGWHLVVLADPDVLAAHGLGRGDNAVLAARLVERLAAGGAPIVIDETLHGHAVEPSLARELFRFPLVLGTLQALLALALLAWAALVRFGRPLRPADAFAPGKAFLVDNTAALLRHGGHAGAAVAAYLHGAKEAVAHRLRPAGDRAEAQDAWVARMAAVRGRGDTLLALEARVRALPEIRRGADEEAVRTAQAIHAFRQEMTDGADGDSRPDRAVEG